MSVITSENINALASLINTGAKAAPAMAPAVEREKSQFWANTQFFLDYEDGVTGETRKEWFTAYGTALDNLKERTLQGQPKTAESHLFHSQVATQNHFTEEGKKIAANLKPGEFVVIAGGEAVGMRLVIQRAKEAQAAIAPRGVGVKLPSLVGAVPQS